jgi:Zn-dependent peptidase ImmA (M78 family)/DNA-binding Xre family transcriptional regulator
MPTAKKVEISKDFEVNVNNKILKWAIETSGWNKLELAKKIGINENDLNKVLDGKKNLTLNKLEKLCKLIKRPIAFFLLNEIPPEENKPLPKDYRMVKKRESFSKEALMAIRVARRLQAVSKELLQNLGETLEAKVKHVTTEEDSKKIANEYRNKIENLEELQKKLNPNNFFNLLRDFIEKQNIFVFQLPIPTDADIGGFTLSDETPNVIVINSKYQIKSRIFTLIHEFGHILLNQSIVDIPEKSLQANENQNKIEKWCNDFASEFLLPDSIAKTLFTENKASLTDTKTLNKLSNRWKVSKSCLLYKMYRLDFITKPEYDEVLGRPYKEKKMKGGPSPDVRCISEKGKRFISLVATNLDNEFITLKDALDYLSIKSNHYPKILEKIKE